MRKKFVEVYDNILPKELSDLIEKLVLEESFIPLYYTSNIAKKSSKNFYPAFGATFHDPLNNNFQSCSYIFSEVVYRLGNALNMAIESIMIGRVFVHLPSPTPGLDEKHTDTPDDHFVCLYYINDSEGDTVIFDDNGKEIKRITPKKGRIVFFEGSMEHCSSRPATKTRAILNFNFRGHRFGKEK
jgi:hypothetical protein